MIYNSSVFTSSLKDMTSQLRNVGYFGPVVITVKIPDPKVLTGFQGMHNVVLLEKPYEKKDLVGITRKFLRATKVNQRRFSPF